jgi:hypothetical protein
MMKRCDSGREADAFRDFVRSGSAEADAELHREISLALHNHGLPE